ncbi:MAG: class I SAM-dependent methyltransferase [Actinomycetota bacterium]
MGREGDRRRRARRPRRDPVPGLPRGARRALRRDQLDRHVRARRALAARVYFGGIERLLRPGGRLLNHGISRPPNAGRTRFRRKSFIDRYVFPDGELHEVGNVVSTIQRSGLEVRHVESLREHYALTLRAWVRNLEADWDGASMRSARGGRACGACTWRHRL